MACTLGIEQPCSECRMCGNPPGDMEGKPPKRTNADRIRNMTNEEQAGFLERFQQEVPRKNMINFSCFSTFRNGEGA